MMAHQEKEKEEVEVVANGFINYLSELSEQARTHLLYKEFEKYSIGNEKQISVQGLESLIANVVREYRKDYHNNIKKENNDKNEDKDEDKEKEERKKLEDVKLIVEYLMEKIRTHPECLKHDLFNTSSTGSKFNWAFVYNLANYASNTSLQSPTETPSWDSPTTAYHSQKQSRGSIIVFENEEENENNNNNNGNNNANNNNDNDNNNTNDQSSNEKKTHEKTPKARESWQIEGPIDREQDINNNTNNPNSSYSTNNSIPDQDSSSSITTATTRSNQLKHQPRETRTIDTESLTINEQENEYDYGEEVVVNGTVRRISSSKLQTSPNTTNNPTLPLSSNEHQELIKECRETSSRLKEIILQLSDFEDGVMREIIQINDRVSTSASNSTETLYTVKRIHDKQEQYHQEEIMRLGTEVTSKMEKSLMISTATGSPQSQLSQYNGIGPRSVSMRGSITPQIEKKSEIATKRASRIRNRHNRSATLTAIADQMYEYKDYTARVEIDKNNLTPESKVAPDRTTPSVNLDTVREDVEPSESDESISSQEHPESHTTSRSKRRNDKANTTGDNMSKKDMTSVSTPEPKLGNLSIPGGDTAHNRQVSQWSDLQQSMDELLRHLKQPSIINFQKMLEKGLHQPFGIPTKMPSTEEEEEEEEEEENESDPDHDTRKTPITPEEQPEDLQKEADRLKKLLNTMQNTQQTLETNLKYKEAIIDEQKRALQHEKDFRSTVQEWKNDLLKEITTLVKPNQSDEQMPWGEDSFKAIGALGVGQNEILEKLNRILDIQKRLQSNHQHGQGSNNSAVPENNLTTNQMQQLTQITSKLTQDMSTVSMLSALREEYKIIREERDTLKRQMDQFRKQNSELLTRVNQLEEETTHLRESKRATVKNMVDEMNEMRDKIALLSHILKSQGSPLK